MDGQTVLTKATKYAASTVTVVGNNKDLKELSVVMKQLTATVTLSVKTHSGGDGGGIKTPK